MSRKLSIPEIIDLWPRQEDLASDCAVDRVAVSRWRSRNRIPSWHLSAMLESARKRQIKVTADQLADAMSASAAGSAKKREKTVNRVAG